MQSGTILRRSIPSNSAILAERTKARIHCVVYSVNNRIRLSSLLTTLQSDGTIPASWAHRGEEYLAGRWNFYLGCSEMTNKLNKSDLVKKISLHAEVSKATASQMVESLI